MQQLIEKFRAAVKHSICDVITEFSFLPTPVLLPLTDDSKEAKDESDTSQTPAVAAVEEEEVKQQVSTPKTKRTFSFVSDFFRQASISNRDTKVDYSNIIFKYDAFSIIHLLFIQPESTAPSEQPVDVGNTEARLEVHPRNLHPLYARSTAEWLHRCHELGCAAVSRCQFTLRHVRSAVYVISDVERCLRDVTSDSCIRLFRCGVKADEFIECNLYKVCTMDVQLSVRLYVNGMCNVFSRCRIRKISFSV